MRNRCALAMLGLLWIGGAARAEWQYTHWGMTAEQIVEASGGMARAIHGDEQKQKSNELHFTTLALAPYSVGNFTFEVSFRAKAGGSVLNEVSLELREAGHYQALWDALEEKYGKGEVLPGEDLMGIATRKSIQWKTKTDIVRLLRDDYHAPMDPRVELKYQQRPSSEGL